MSQADGLRLVDGLTLACSSLRVLDALIPLESCDDRVKLQFGKNSPFFQGLKTVCLFAIPPQHLYSIHLSEQPEDSTIQLADHIKVRCLGQWLSPL